MTVNVGDKVIVVDTEPVNDLTHFFDLGDVGIVKKAYTAIEWFDVVREDGLRQTVYADHIEKLYGL